MNKTDKAKKEKNIQKSNIENYSNSAPKIQNINTNTTMNQHQKTSIPKNEEQIFNKINKPKELKELDALSHFKYNITHAEKNCIDPITDSSYYCFTCKTSVCNKCGVNNHKDHILIQRNNCLFYDNSFFNEISKVIEDSLLIEEKKSDIKNKISDSIDELKNTLDVLKNNKFKEIDNIFIKLKNNLLLLKNNFLKTKKTIEDYYSINKDFFNIDYNINNNNCINENNIYNNKTDNNLNNKNNNNDNNKINNIKSKNNKNELIIKNKDNENTIFMLNFDLMNICDNKNIAILDFINSIKNKINAYIDEINQKTISIQNNVNHYLDVYLDIDKFDDFYKEINLRVSKYTEHINLFKDTICEIIRKTSNLEKIKDLINILESKNNKGKQKIFEQDFFKNHYLNTNTNTNTNINTNSNINNKNSDKKIRQNSKIKQMKRGISGDFKFVHKNKFITNNNNNNKQSLKFETENNVSFNNIKTNLIKRNSSKTKKTSISPFKTIGNNKSNSKNKKIHKSISFYEPRLFNPNYKPLNSKDIILNQRILQKFFAYSIYGLYTKYYNNNSSKIKDNVITKKNNTKNINKNINISPLPLSELKNAKNGDIEEIKTVSYLTNYTQRYNKLKEKAKPIIGTNQIQLYDLNTKKIVKKVINLTKEEHGYALFPEGCRHILLRNNLYITGGTDMYGMPINIVLLYNLQTNTISKINNLIDNHSYHSLDYIENYDCIVLIGGEYSRVCEIMDLDLKKWYKLPELNYARANVNIYFNSINNELYALFGINGDISDKKIQYSDIIEVIEIDNISNGWNKIDYYKGSGFNIKNNYCMTLPFTSDKLLLYGAENLRTTNKYLFALFDMNKNECIKVDINTLEQIKLEEKKIRLVDLALNKMNFEN